MDKLKYIEITTNNIDFATRIQMEIFPNESAYEHYKYVIKSKLDYMKNYIVYKGDEVVGITGIYSNEDLNETNSIWLGWFGVREKYRSNGYGRQILIDTFEIAKELSKKYPIKYFRLYTSERDDKLAQPLYEKVMDIKEYYNNDEDINYDGTCVIYSKSFDNSKVEYWNNKFLNLKEIVDEQEIGNLKFNKN